MKILIPETENKHEIGRVYYHFMFGFLLPVFGLIQREIIKLGDTVCVIHIGNLIKFKEIISELKKYGIIDITTSWKNNNVDKYISIQSFEHYYTSMGPPIDRFVKFDIDIEKVISLFCVQEFHINTAIVKRNDTKRIVPNLNEIAEKTCGIVFEPNKSLINQIELFRSAKTIICQHGSDLANMVFCKKGTKIIEIIPQRFFDSGYHYYRRACKDFGLEHQYVFQKEINSEVDINEIIRWIG